LKLKNIIMLIFLSGFLVTVFFPTFVNSHSEINPQEVLLNFLSQELIAHGAMFFAATAATFRFVTHFVDERNNGHYMLSRRSVIFTLFSGLMLGLIVFLAFRILYYGAMSTMVTYSSPMENQTLGQYTSDVYYTMLDRTSNDTIEILYFNLIKSTSKGFLDFRPFSMLPVSVYVGFFISFLLSYGFRSNGIEKPIIWAPLFIIPAFLGLIGSVMFWSESARVEWISVPVVIYVLYPIVIKIAHKFGWISIKGNN